MNRILVFSSLIVLIISCSPKDQNNLEELPFFKDPVIRTIYDFQDRRDADSLKQFLLSENPIYRRQAALAFASVQGSSTHEELFSLVLSDPVSDVREAAAYSLGQVGDSSLTEKLLFILDQEKDSSVRKTTLEAIGKCITQNQLPQLRGFVPSSTPEKEGFVWGLYRALLRGVYDDAGTSVVLDLLHFDEKYEVRRGAASYLARLPQSALSSIPEDLIISADFEKAPQVRMMVATALGKVYSEDAFKKLQKLANDVDYRVQINAIRAMSSPSYQTKESCQLVVSYLSDEDHQVAVATAEALQGFDPDWVSEMIQTWNLQDIYWRARRNVQVQLMGTSLRDSLLVSLISDYSQSKNPYDQALILQALSEDLKNYEFLVNEAFAQKHAAIANAAVSGLVKLRRAEGFPEELKPVFAEIFKNAMLSGDLALIGLSAQALRDTTLGILDEYNDLSFLAESKEKLSLPKDNEALQILEELIAFTENKELEPVKNEFNHPIQWSLIEEFTGEQKMIISTNEGDIIIGLLYKESPGSVVNFLELVNTGYYPGIKFHRVVPNFVAQGGCNRGDGWGGLDYSIRSEWGPVKYKTGSIGMASAGKDTEGTQFFITHSPTPHLDGRYTIFAEVLEGMDVVQKLSMGTEILKIEMCDTCTKTEEDPS